jgi:glutaconyl-CoA/methylmalonyl-CoA decarboxylase subunit delta
MINTVLLQTAVQPKVNETAQAFGEMDPYGIMMTFIAMSVVFTALILLYLTFKYVSRLYSIDVKSRRKKSKTDKNDSIAFEDIPSDINVAIAMALHLYMSELHDKENTKITIKNMAKSYSPWSSKIYGLRQVPK